MKYLLKKMIAFMKDDRWHANGYALLAVLDDQFIPNSFRTTGDADISHLIAARDDLIRRSVPKRPDIPILFIEPVDPPFCLSPIGMAYNGSDQRKCSIKTAAHFTYPPLLQASHQARSHQAGH